VRALQAQTDCWEEVVFEDGSRAPIAYRPVAAVA
jgi:hypothetical protein